MTQWQGTGAEESLDSGLAVVTDLASDAGTDTPMHMMNSIELKDSR